MQHLRNVSRRQTRPEEATSLLVVQQKISIFGAFAAGLGAMGNAIETFVDLGAKE